MFQTTNQSNLPHKDRTMNPTEWDTFIYRGYLSLIYSNIHHLQSSTPPTRKRNLFPGCWYMIFIFPDVPHFPALLSILRGCRISLPAASFYFTASLGERWSPWITRIRCRISADKPHRTQWHSRWPVPRSATWTKLVMAGLGTKWWWEAMKIDFEQQEMRCWI